MRKEILLTLFTVLLLALSAVPAAAQKSKVQCWTDEKGQRMCGDHVPPQYADKERKVINQEGYVVETRKGPRTPEEIAEEQRKKKEAEDAKKLAEYDRQLVQTYRNVKDIEVMRDERLASLDSRIRITETNLAANEKVLEDLKGRADAQAADNKPVDERLAKQIKQYRRSLKDNQKALATFNRERAQTEQKFNQDIARFSALKGLPAPTAAAAAPKASAPAAAPSPPAEAKKPGG